MTGFFNHVFLVIFQIQVIAVTHRKISNSGFRYWWNEIVRGGNYVLHYFEHENLIKTNAKLREKFIKSLRERLAFVRTKKKQLDADLNMIKRESRVAFEDLKDCIYNLKSELKRTDEVIVQSKSQKELELLNDSKLLKKIREMLREETRQSSYQPHDVE